jgi:hypothetical protein
MKLTDQQDLRDIWTLENMTSGAGIAYNRLVAKYGEAAVKDTINQYEARGQYGNPIVQSFAGTSDNGILAIIAKYPDPNGPARWAQRYHRQNIGFSSWGELATMIGRSYLAS